MNAAAKTRITRQPLQPSATKISAIGTGSEAHNEIEPANAKAEKRDESDFQTQSGGLQGETLAGTPASTQCGLSFRSETKIARPAELSIWARYFASPRLR